MRDLFDEVFDAFYKAWDWLRDKIIVALGGVTLDKYFSLLYKHFTASHRARVTVTKAFPYPNMEAAATAALLEEIKSEIVFKYTSEGLEASIDLFVTSK